LQSEWRTHKGKRFMYANYAGFGEDVDRLAAEVDTVDAIICQEPEHSVLILTDVRATVGSSEAVAVMKKSAARTKKYMRKGVIVGIGGGIRKLLLEAVSRFSGQDLVAFDDIEQAKDWLVEE